MGGSNSKKEIKVEKKQETKNMPKKQYYSGIKAKKQLFNDLNDQKLYLDGFDLNKPLQGKKLQSPKKKEFKESLCKEADEDMNKIIKLQQEIKKSEISPRKSPRLKVNRHSICYSGEFAVVLQQSEINENKEVETKNSLIKDLSCLEALKVIGRGTFGKVVLVRNKNDKQLLALKCMKKLQILKNKNIENIKNEKKILEKINNPFIIKLRFTFQTREKIYMAFEYYNGGELFFHLQKHHRFSENLTKFYAAEIYLALRYLHSNGIIYRDLKPENIILDRTGHIKLIDFGLAKDGISLSNLTTTICGTNEYIPPEVICGKKYGFNFDWWGFGNIIYEMLFGHPAFTDQSKPALFKKIVNMEPSYRAVKLSDDALDLLKKLMNKDPTLRIKPENIILHPWFKNINFDDINKLKVTPPFVPKIKNEEDLSNIDPFFLNEAVNSPVKSVNIKIDQDYFSDF